MSKELKKITNQDIADLLREAATALTIKKGSIFQVRAYEGAADAIEHATASIRDLWEENNLDSVPGVGEHIQNYLDEYFTKGKVEHFEKLKKGIPEIVFELITIPSIGPKTALELAEMDIKSVQQLQDEIKNGKLVEKGFSAKIAEKIMMGIEEREGLKSGRMLLPFATLQAEKIIAYLMKSHDVLEAYPLGSLRRRVATIGDLDFAVSSKLPENVIDYFLTMPEINEVINHGENKATVVLHSGTHVDILVGKPESFGALLQHFTGSKHHNIALRTLAEKQQLSLSEYGVKNILTNKLVPIKTEEEFYNLLKMQTPAPEMRENNGEIELALTHSLPKLIEEEDIKGDLHLHSNFPLEPSHGPGANSLAEIVQKGEELGYEYIGISDHPPGYTTNTNVKIIGLINARNKAIDEIKYSNNKIRVLNGLEVDILPDGQLSVPNEGLATLDYVIAGIHSSHKMNSEQMTKRLLTALSNPYVKIISHPTGRILNQRESFEAEWDKIFAFCAKNKKVLEINAFPNRLDLREDLIKRALEFEVKLIIDTDAHEISQMENMRFGVYLARRGWASKESIINSWDWEKIAEWFNLPK